MNENAQNVVLDGDMAYIEDGHLVIVIPIPEFGLGWVPDKGDSVERVTVVDALNGVVKYGSFMEDGTQQPIKGLDDPTAKLTVKLTCDPIVARDDLGQEIRVRERNVKGATTKRERRGIPLDELTGKAADKSRKAGPVTTRKMTPLEKAKK